MSIAAITITLALYLALLFGVAWWSARHSSNATFFTANRSTPRTVAAVAMVGAAMSGVTYISVPGTVLLDHFSYLQTTLGFFVGYVIIAFVLIPLYYRLGVVSLYEYLDSRFGIVSHRTGAWLFFISKIAAASLRAYVVCVVLQSLLFERLGIPFTINAAMMMALVWLYTRRGGVRTVVWTELLKTVLMVTSIVACIVLIATHMNLDIGGVVSTIAHHDYAEAWFFDNPLDRRYFWKQFLSGIFLVVAMTGLDQDMMQTVLSCRNRRDSQRSLMLSIVVQMAVIVLFLGLGVLFYTFLAERGITPLNGGFPLVDSGGQQVVMRGDDIFGYVATMCGLPTIVGVLFLLGLAASTYSAAGSALTALTTSFTLDILGGRGSDEHRIGILRSRSHTLIAVAMTLIIIAFHQWSTSGVITLIFTMAGYTYGPLLGMFAFGILSRRRLKDGIAPVVAIVSPTVCYIVASHSEVWFDGYQFSYELLILNALISMAMLWLFSSRNGRQ